MDDNPIDVAASGWALRAEAGPLSLDVRAELDAWLAADIRHRGAFARACAGLAALNRLTAVAGWSTSLASDVRNVKGHSRGRVRVIKRRMLLAGGLAAVVAGLISWLGMSLRVDQYESGPGEELRVVLEDGSRIELDADSSVTAHFKQTLREIRLTRGEAMFRVAKDRDRPFLVHAHGANIKAVGTAFAIRAEAQGAEVAVTEGSVDVWCEDSPQTVQPVHALQRALVREGPGIMVTNVAPEEMTRDLAWQDGLVIFDGQPLADAVRQMNRRSRLKLQVDDPELAAQTVVGVFHAFDAAAFADTAAIALNFRVARDGSTIYLQPKLTRPRQ